jgi:hypothetical protein
MVARGLSLAALLVALTTPAYGGLPVAYDAHRKAFKKSVHGGDPLGFSLYGTPDCSGTPVYSEILGAGTPQVFVEDVAPLDMKKAKDEPRIARLRAVLGVEVVDMALYLRVQADGVEPVGEACQVQVAAVVGAGSLLGQRSLHRAVSFGGRKDPGALPRKAGEHLEGGGGERDRIHPGLRVGKAQAAALEVRPFPAKANDLAPACRLKSTSTT